MLRRTGKKECAEVKVGRKGCCEKKGIRLKNKDAQKRRLKKRW